MPTKQRIAVNFLFSLGFIVTIAGIVRTWYIYKSLILEYDQTWYAYPLWICAAVETDLGVICTSAPVLRPLLARLPLSLSGMTSKSRSGGRTPHESNRSKTAVNATVGSKRSRSKEPESTIFQTTVQDRASHYEMGTWVDVERGRTHSLGSQEAILHKAEGILEPNADFRDSGTTIGKYEHDHV
jgi:hypothetical protein